MKRAEEKRGQSGFSTFEGWPAGIFHRAEGDQRPRPQAEDRRLIPEPVANRNNICD